MFLRQASSAANPYQELILTAHTRNVQKTKVTQACAKMAPITWNGQSTVFIKCDFAKYCFKKRSSLSIIKAWNSHSRHINITQCRILYIRYIIILYIRFLQLCGRMSYSGIQLWNVFSITKSNKTLEELIKSVCWSQRKCVCLPCSLTN